MNTTEEIIDAFNTLTPLWDDATWTALQEQRFDDAEKYLQGVLSQMPSESWATVYWQGILVGIPAFRGDIDIATWNNRALPCIDRAIIKSASTQKISEMYMSIDPDALRAFHNQIVTAIPGGTIEGKTDWIKQVGQTPLLGFFIASPLGLHLSGSDFLMGKNVARLKTIPENIKSVLFSMQTPGIIKETVEQNNIPAEKTPLIADLIGLVFLGFTHPEDLGHEIEKQAGIPTQTAKSLADSLNKKLFVNIRSELDKIYAPLPQDAEISGGPKMIQEIKAPSSTQPPQPTAVGFASKASPMTQLTPQPGTGLKSNASSPILNKDGTAPVPKSTSDIGWSKQTSQNPVVQLGVITPSMPSPTQGANASAVPKPQVPQQSATSAVKGMSEFERIDAIKKGGVPQIPKAPTIGSAPVAPATTAAPTPTAAPQPKPQEAAPMMLHEIPSQTSLQTSPNFKFSITAENQIDTAGPQKSIQEKPAMVEFGNRPAASSGAPTPTAPASTPKMVHYSEYKTSIPPLTPSANDGPRQITEIGMQTPGMTPGIAPMTPPPMPPKPPSPAPAPMQTSTQPPTQQGKVIVQDFLDPKKP